MKYFEIYDPRNPTNDDFRVLIRIFSEQQILSWYFPSWEQGMIKIGKQFLINKENCISDWCVINWAVYIGDF